MYNYVSTGMGSIKNLKDLRVCDMGSGRGGGIEYMVRYLGASEGVGLTRSEN
jgi:hypothetical protein